MKHLIYLWLIVSVFSSCKIYKSNIVLKTKDNKDMNWKDVYEKAIVEHPIAIGDKIQFKIYTNFGESIIDPGGNLVKAPAANVAGGSLVESGYDVLESGFCHFPVIGKINVFGLKTSQLDSLLSIKYEKLYNDVYVISKVVNRKVIVLKNLGSQLVPYRPNMNILEVIAAVGGLDNASKGYNIRIVRGDLSNPEVKVVNLKTISSLVETNINIKPDDIIYIEPVRKPLAESITDNFFILNLAQVALTFIVLINTFNR